MKNKRLLLTLALFLLAAAGAHAQITLRIELPRRTYILYEPIVATVSVTNRTGQDIILRDTESQPWFGFEILGENGSSVPPNNLDYHIAPLAMGSGETVKRKINLTTLYALSEFGSYNVRATVYYAPLDRYFSSAKDSLQLSDGNVIWEQTVGAPADSEGAGGGYRQLSLLTHRTDRRTLLYYRVLDRDGGRVFATEPLGQVVMGQPPGIMLDAGNRLHVLQLIAPKTYIYSRITPDGALLGQNTILAVKERPELRQVAGGAVGVKGGVVEELAAADAAAPVSARPKLSERPPGMPQ